MPAVSRLSALAPLVLLLACDFDLGEPDRYQRLTLSAAELTSLRIDAGAGDLTIAADPEAVDITIVAGIHGDHTEISHARTGTTLELTDNCASWHRCAVDWRVTVPTELAAELDTGAGDIHVTGLTGSVHATTGSGDIRVTGLTGSLRATTGSGDIDLADLAGDVNVDTGSGDITGERLQVTKFHGETGSGDLALELSNRPRSVWWSSGSGDVDVSVPAGAYALDLETGLGDIDLAGVRRDPAADATLRLHTGLGDITVAG